MLAGLLPGPCSVLTGGCSGSRASRVQNGNMRRSGGPGDGLEVTRKLLLHIIPTLFLKAN